MKTVEELNALKEEAEAVKIKLAGLTNEELSQVFGGEDEGQNETLWCWKCYNCGAEGGPIAKSEAQAAVFSHMETQKHYRILVAPQ